MKLKTLLLLGLALLAVYMGRRAARRNAEVLQALWVLIGMTAMAGTANTPKARSTEARLNSLIPQVFPNTGGTVDGNVNVTGNHSVGGTLSVTGASTSEFGAGIHAGGELLADGGVSTAVVTSTSSATSEFTGGIHTGGGFQADGNSTLRQVNGAALPMGTVGSLSGTVTVTQCASAINGLISRLQSVGFIS